MEKKTIAVYADVQNIYYTTRDFFNKPFNYRVLWQKLEQQGDIVIAKAYAIDRGDDSQRKFQDALRHMGFELMLKPWIHRADGSAKGDWDVGIAIDVMEGAPEVDTVVLLSGDGDFACLLERIKQRFGVKTEVYGVKTLTAQSLIDEADVFHSIQGELIVGEK